MRELVWGICYERVERMPQPSLTNQLERSAPHPRQHIQLNLPSFSRVASCGDTGADGGLKPAANNVEKRNHLPHVCDREHGIKHLALPAMVITCHRERLQISE